MGGIDPAALASLLGRRGRFQGPVLVFDTVESTQDEASRWVRAGHRGTAAFLARTQKAGRGRLGRSWYSPPGGLYATLCLRPSTPSDRWPGLAVAAGLALAETLDDAGVVAIELKWPNDCRIHGRKLAGILSQALPDAGAVLVGVGLNVALDAAGLLPELAGQVTSLADALPVGCDPLAVCADGLERIANACGAAGNGVPLDPNRVRRFLAIGARVSVGGHLGRIRGVTGTGALLLAVEGEDDDVVIDVGEVCDAGGD